MIQTDTLPLQTRACVLTPEWLEEVGSVATSLEKLRDRGYNTVVLPVFRNGEPLVPVNRHGELLPKKRTTTLGILGMLAEIDLTVWLGVDPLSAGDPEEGDLSALARHHPHWLMKNAEGYFACPQMEEVSGLFCWTALEYRRFLGNMLVTLADGYPFDGIVFDYRLTPCATGDPETWTHFGYSCLSRLQNETGLDLEQHLQQPTVEQFEAVVEWRRRQLGRFVENVKARVRRVQSQLLFLLLGRVPANGEPPPPWMASYARGLFEGALLETRAEDFPHHFAELDRLSGAERTILAAIATEEQIEALSGTLAEVPSPGFAILQPGAETTAPMPPVAAHWDQHGAMETRPVYAVQAILEHVTSQDIDGDTSATLRQALSDLYPGWSSFHLPQAMDLRARLRKLRKEKPEFPANLLREIDLAERLLPLIPPKQEDQ